MPERLNKNGLTEKEFLERYDGNKYPSPSNTVDTVIFSITSEEEKNKRKLAKKELQVLLIERADHPWIGQVALPGGFVNINEGLSDAAYRELKEETGIDNVYLEQLYTYGDDVKRDPRKRVISISYLSLVNKKDIKVKAGDDAYRAVWFTVKDRAIKEEKISTDTGFIINTYVELQFINGEEKYSAIVKRIRTIDGNVSKLDYEGVDEDKDNIAADHAKLIFCGLDRLRNKVEYTDIAFSLMPELFTLSELQSTYEVLLGKELIPAAFRRKIEKSKHMVLETGMKEKDVQRRPATYYRFNPNWTDDEAF